jgi:hypothetical protein
MTEPASPPCDPLAAIHLVGKTWEPGRTLKIGFLEGSRRPAEEGPALGRGVAPVRQPQVRSSTASNPRSGWPSTPNAGSWRTSGPTPSSSGAADHQLRVGDGRLGRRVRPGRDPARVRPHARPGHEQSPPGPGHQVEPGAALAGTCRRRAGRRRWSSTTCSTSSSAGVVEGTAYDRTSIMQYPVPAELTLDGRGIGWNTTSRPGQAAHRRDVSGRAGLRAAHADPAPTRSPSRATCRRSSSAARRRSCPSRRRASPPASR